MNRMCVCDVRYLCVSVHMQVHVYMSIVYSCMPLLNQVREFNLTLHAYLVVREIRVCV